MTCYLVTVLGLKLCPGIVCVFLVSWAQSTHYWGDKSLGEFSKPSLSTWNLGVIGTVGWSVGSQVTVTHEHLEDTHTADCMHIFLGFPSDSYQPKTPER